MKKMKYILLTILFGMTSAAVDAQNYYKMGEQVALFNEVCRRLQNMYVDTLNPEQMISDAVRGMTEKMDPYTEFYSAQDKDKLKQMLTGKYAGVGAIIKYCLDKKQVVVDYPYTGSPAMKGGFEMGDQILAINDTSMVGKSTAYVSSHLRGEPGTTIKVKLKKRSTGKVVTTTIVRETIKLPEIPCSFIYDDNGTKIGVISLSEFTQGCYGHFKDAFLELKRDGMEKLVIDIRGNSGGSVQEAVDIINIFIARGELVVQTRGRNSQQDRQYKATKDPLDQQIPLIVLVDDESASASEILSGCLQDLDRAKIVGEKTYGKGIVQQTVPLQNDAEMKVTVSRYYLPSGRCIQARNYNKGKEEQVADSLKHTFYTRSGKEVVDGSGIAPDVELKADTMARITYYLHGNDSTELVHNFVCDYLNKYKEIPAAENFKLSDTDYAEFKKRVIAADFKYDPFTEKMLSQLKEMAKVEGYFDDSKSEFEALEKKLRHNIDHDLEFHKKDIQALLEFYIQTGANGVEEGAKSRYKYDSVFLKALNEF